MAERLMKADKTRITGKKLKMAEMLANPEFTGTNKDLYQAVGISHDTFYKWIKDRNIIAYAEKLIDRYTDSELGAVWKALLKKCREGDIQAIKLYFELKGKYGKNMTNHNVGGNQGVILMPDIMCENEGVGDG